MYSPELPYGGVDIFAPLPDSGIARATQTHVLLQRANYLAAYAYDTSVDERAGIKITSTITLHMSIRR